MAEHLGVRALRLRLVATRGAHAGFQLVGHETFYSLSELNARIAELLRELNARTPFQLQGEKLDVVAKTCEDPTGASRGQETMHRRPQHRASRRELFERLDKPALKAPPADRFVFGEWKLCKLLRR